MIWVTRHTPFVLDFADTLKTAVDSATLGRHTTPRVTRSVTAVLIHASSNCCELTKNKISTINTIGAELDSRARSTHANQNSRIILSHS